MVLMEPMAWDFSGSTLIFRDMKTRWKTKSWAICIRHKKEMKADRKLFETGTSGGSSEDVQHVSIVGQDDRFV